MHGDGETPFLFSFFFFFLLFFPFLLFTVEFIGLVVLYFVNSRLLRSEGVGRSSNRR
jgi:hypothetical protein